MSLLLARIAQAHRSTGTVVPTTWNPAAKGADVVLSNGNLTAAPGTGSSTYEAVRATLSRSTGKWCVEFKCDIAGASNYAMLGLANSSMPLGPSATAYPGGDASGWGYYQQTGDKYHGGVSSAYGALFGTGDVVTLYWDASAGLIWWAKNGVVQGGGNPSAGTGSAFSGVTGALYPATSLYGPNAGTFTLRPSSTTIAYPIAGFGAWDGS